MTGGGYRIYAKYGDSYKLAAWIGNHDTLSIPILDVVNSDGYHDLFITAVTAGGLESSYGLPLRVNIMRGIPVVIGIPSAVTGFAIQCGKNH